MNAAYQAAELYDAVIYAAPAHCADEVDLAFEGGDRVKTLTSIDHPPVGVLALGFRRGDVAHKLDGFGFLVPDVERRNVLGVIFSSTVFPGALPTGTCCSPRSWAECATQTWPTPTSARSQRECSRPAAAAGRAR